MVSEQYSLCWDNFHKNMSSGMNSLLKTEDLVDVTIAVESRHLKAHKMVLSVCSPYFRELFKVTPCKHPIVFLKDVSYAVMNDLLQFMYQGEVQVSEEHLSTFIKTGEALQIKGLTGDGNGLIERGDDFHGKGKGVEMDISKLNHEELHKSQTSSSPVPKRLKLEQGNPSEPSLQKTDMVTEKLVATTTIAPSDDQLVSFKMEPHDQDQSLGENSFDESFIDDSADIHEDYIMAESGDEEIKEETSVDGVGEDGQDSPTITISEKSKERYEQVYLKFEQWCVQKEEQEIVEPVVLAYFQEKSKTQKSSTLWCYYSMLRTVIFIKKGLDIKSYPSVVEFLKHLPKVDQKKKSKMFTKQEIAKFLTQADDRIYLMMKVVLVLGIAGSCTRDELTYLRTDDIKDEGNYIQITVPTRKIGDEREFVLMDGTIKGFSLLQMFRKYVNLRSSKTDHNRFFVSYRNGQCTVQRVGTHTISAVPSKIAEFLGLENPREYTIRRLRSSKQVRFF